MNAENLVTVLLENDVYGPPAPDNFLNAVGTTRELRNLSMQKVKTLVQMDTALQMERQLRKAGVKKEDVFSYIRAKDKYRGYSDFTGRGPKGSLPPDAFVGMKLKDGREIMFDMAVFPEQA